MSMWGPHRILVGLVHSPKKKSGFVIGSEMAGNQLQGSSPVLMELIKTNLMRIWEMIDFNSVTTNPIRCGLTREITENPTNCVV